jgi:poly-beta-1,6-N-acetyl-D-glucosamine synthase
MGIAACCGRRLRWFGVDAYALITPARNEADNLRRLAVVLVRQSVRPVAWVIVDDGSADATPVIARELSDRYSWVTAILSSGVTTHAGPLAAGRRIGRDVIAFHAGLRTLAEPVGFVAKLDADVSFGPDYFERLLMQFAADETLGIASGICCEEDADGVWRLRHVTRSHVRGATRMWRWDCLEQLLPLPERLGWDVVDELRANTLGWRTRSFDDLEFRHHRPVGARDGAWDAWAAQGWVAHYVGYRPSYLVLRALYKALREPAALALLSGYCTAVIRRDERYPDPAVRQHLRRQQSFRRLRVRFREVVGRAA